MENKINSQPNILFTVVNTSEQEDRQVLIY